ncbi:hypothetical protein [Brevibacterium litoralis]|uniref:hypothetical protein n=1 Tax=Brevibacterium litoralis TaxID=3138935 RepID=UPI0032EED3AB
MVAIEVRPYDDSLSADAADVIARYLSDGQLGQAGGSTLAAVVTRVQESGTFTRVLAVLLGRLGRDIRLSLVYTGGRAQALVFEDVHAGDTEAAGRLSTLRKDLPSDPSWKTALLTSLAKKFLLKPAVWNLALRLLKDTRSWDVRALTGGREDGLFIAFAPESAYADGTVGQAQERYAEARGAAGAPATGVYTAWVAAQVAADRHFRGAGFSEADRIAIPGLRLRREQVELVSAHT